MCLKNTQCDYTICIKQIKHWLLIMFHSIGKWLVPPSAPRPKSLSQKLKDSLPPQFSMMYWRNNRQFVSFLFFIISVNIILFVHRAYYFKDFSSLSGSQPNGFYMMSRANGKWENWFCNCYHLNLYFIRCTYSFLI